MLISNLRTYVALEVPEPTLHCTSPLAAIELGTDLVEKSAAFEVLLRRLQAVNWADAQGKWDQACFMEELPSERTPPVHGTIVRSLLKTARLVATSSATFASPASPQPASAFARIAAGS